jgi:hypothetical protein
LNVAQAGGFYYSINLPIVIEELKSNDLLRIIVYRTSSGGGELQGININTGSLISGFPAHGTKGYTLSVSKI